MNFLTPEQLQTQQSMALFHNSSGVDESRIPSGSNPAYLSLDAANAAKQMAALNASQYRRTSQSGGTSDTLFGPRPDATAPNTTNSAAQSARGVAPNAQVQKSRRDEFLRFIAGIMNSRGTPLPSTITGVPVAYDPSTSPWKSLEPTAEPGGFRLAGKDIDLFKLWQLALSHGGHAKLTRESGWNSLLSHFGLPEELSDSQGNSNSVSRLLAHYYVGLLAPFEEVYLRNMQQQQQKVMQARQQQQQQQEQQQYQQQQYQQQRPQSQPQPQTQIQPQPQPQSQPQPQPPPQPQPQTQPQRHPQQYQQQQPGSTPFPGHNPIDPTMANVSSQQSQISTQAVPTSSGLRPVSAGPPQVKPDLLQQMNPGGFRYDQYPASPSHGLDATTSNQPLPSDPPVPNAQNPTPHTSDMSQLGESDTQNLAGQIHSPSLSHGDGKGGEFERKKRKLQEEESGKRARQRTDVSVPSQQTGQAAPQSGTHGDNQSQTAGPGQGRHSSPSRSSANNTTTTRQPRVRRKIEYIPLARELDTYGGRELEMIDSELAKAGNRRPQRSMDEWGTIDIEGLTMSLRSRLPTELSYAITALSALSTMRGQIPDTGLSLQQCDELLDVLLDLLREQAFGEAEDNHSEGDTFCAHRELVSFVRDNELQSLTCQPRDKIRADLARASKPTSTDLIFAILNLFRNLSLTGENQRFMGQHPDVLNMILRLCTLSTPFSDIPQERSLSPASPALSLPNIVKVRRDVLMIVSNLVPFTNLALHPLHVQTRLFELLASFLVESHDLSSPAGIVIQSGAISAGTVRPPLIVDLALEAFSKLAQPDANRHALSRGIKLPWLWSLFSSLVHRLPVSSDDFTITMRMHDVWLSYIEKVVLSIYSICFLASPELKDKIKTDRVLSFPKLILRMVKRFVSINHPEARQYFLVSSRRAIEALKLVDEGNDAFESPQSTGPTLAFGMGFGESDVKQLETGIGLLAGFQDDVTWSIMMMPHLDDVMFAELDSLSRISL